MKPLDTSVGASALSDKLPNVMSLESEFVGAKTDKCQNGKE